MRGLRIIIGAVVAVVLISGAGRDHSHLPASGAEAPVAHQHASHDHTQWDCDADPCDAEQAAQTSCCQALPHGCNALVIDCPDVAVLIGAGVPDAFTAGGGAPARGLRPEAETPPPRS